MDTETHNITTWRIETTETFQWGSGGWWEAEACTPPGVLLGYF